LATREKVAGKVLLLDPELTDASPLLFDLLGVPDPERPVPRMDPEAHQTDLRRHAAPDARPEPAGAGRVVDRRPALDRRRERGVPRGLRRDVTGDAEPPRGELPARVPRRLDAEVLLPAAPPGAARPGSDWRAAARPLGHRSVARRTRGADPGAHGREPLLHRGDRAGA